MGYYDRTEMKTRETHGSNTELHIFMKFLDAINQSLKDCKTYLCLMEENRERNGPSKLMTQLVSRCCIGFSKLNVTYDSFPARTPGLT